MKQKSKSYVPRELKSTIKYIPLPVLPDLYLQEMQMEFGYVQGFHLFNQIKIYLAGVDYHFIRQLEISDKWCRLNFRCSTQEFAKAMQILTDSNYFIEEILDNFNIYFSIDLCKDLFEAYRSKLRNYKGMTKELFPSLIFSLAIANEKIRCNNKSIVTTASKSTTLQDVTMNLQCGNKLITNNDKLNEHLEKSTH
jgi:hypothetical protein